MNFHPPWSPNFATPTLIIHGARLNIWLVKLSGCLFIQIYEFARGNTCYHRCAWMNVEWGRGERVVFFMYISYSCHVHDSPHDKLSFGMLNLALSLEYQPKAKEYSVRNQGFTKFVPNWWNSSNARTVRTTKWPPPCILPGQNHLSLFHARFIFLMKVEGKDEVRLWRGWEPEVNEVFGIRTWWSYFHRCSSNLGMYMNIDGIIGTQKRWGSKSDVNPDLFNKFDFKSSSYVVNRCGAIPMQKWLHSSYWFESMYDSNATRRALNLGNYGVLSKVICVCNFEGI